MTIGEKMNINYDPALEWDKHCDFQEKAKKEYIKENQADQEADLDVFLDKLINFWNPRYINQNGVANRLTGKKYISFNESILLAIWICNYYNGNFMMNFKRKADALYEILAEFPEIDAIEDNFSESLEVAVISLRNYLENLE